MGIGICNCNQNLELKFVIETGFLIGIWVGNLEFGIEIWNLESEFRICIWNLVFEPTCHLRYSETFKGKNT